MTRTRGGPQASGALAALGWSDDLRARFDALGVSEGIPARVVRVERSRCLVVDDTGEPSRVAAAPVPAVGDWVAVAGGTVGGVVERVSALRRMDPDGETVQVLAANVDLVLITAPADRLSMARIERELAVAWDSGARPQVVLTKGDLVDPAALAELRRRVVGTEVVVTSSVTGAGVADLRADLAPHRTAVLLGPSGAGKSTLVNRLLGEDLLATGAVRDGDSRGRHTTTRRQLVVVPSGGVLIDTPGLRSLGLTAGGQGIDSAFADIVTFSHGCRFADCSHRREPGCAVLAAVGDGRLDALRLASYQKLHQETDDRSQRADPRLRKSELARSKAASRAARSAPSNPRRRGPDR